MVRLAVLTCVLGLAASGCGSDRANRGEGTVAVVTTVAPVADIVRNAGGRRVSVTLLVPRGEDPHTWRPGDSALESLRQADLVVLAGGSIDDWAAGSGAERELSLLPRLDPLGHDPHWWQDPVRVERAAKEVRNELARADVDGAGHYEAATADFLERLRRLDRDIRTCIGLLPRRTPRLAAQHDGFAYFASRYGVRIVGPHGRGARVGRRLWADTLEAVGGRADSYLDAMAVNAETIVEALSGGRTTCLPRP